MRRAAQARLQMRAMRPAQQLEGAGPVLALVAGDAAASSSSAPSSAGRQAAPARSAAATSQGRAFKASPASRQCWATCAGSADRASR